MITNESFLNMIKKETGYRRSTLDNLEWSFTAEDTLVNVLQKIVIAPGQRLLDIDKSGQINAIITMIDIFEYLMPTRQDDRMIETEKP